MTLDEKKRIEAAYKARENKNISSRYSLFNTGTMLCVQERERVLLKFLGLKYSNLSDEKLLDIGCGTGGTLLPMVYYGVLPENCFGVDILNDRIEIAKKKYPTMHFECCSPEQSSFEKGSFGIITMFTCLSSILDNQIRETVCQSALEMAKPGGSIIVYDFYVNNPNNSDVKAVKLNELKSYFPGCTYYSKRLTLLPPLSRRLAKYSMALCTLLGTIPLLRTHRLTMFQKPLQGD